MKNKHWVLLVSYISFIVLALPMGGLTVAWPEMMGEMGLLLEQASLLLMANTGAYALTGSQLGRLSRRFRLEQITLLGTCIMTLGLLGMGLSPNLTVLIPAAAVTGIGIGLVDTSLNTYVTKHFSARHLNWMHCVWGAGSSVSPLLMTQMILLFSWRMGYFVQSGILAALALAVFISLVAGVWKRGDSLTAAEPAGKGAENGVVRGLSKRRHQLMQAGVCFLYGGVDYPFVFWVTSVLLESRNLSLERAGLYPAVYYACMMGGRVVFGALAKRLRGATAMRIGFALGVIGVAVLWLHGSIFGMALAGIGFSPIYPFLLHATGQRFRADIFPKLMGYQVAAFGAGIVLWSSVMGFLLSHLTLEALFPIVLVLIVPTFLMNEGLERVLRKAEIS